MNLNTIMGIIYYLTSIIIMTSTLFMEREVRTLIILLIGLLCMLIGEFKLFKEEWKENQQLRN